MFICLVIRCNKVRTDKHYLCNVHSPSPVYTYNSLLQCKLLELLVTKKIVSNLNHVHGWYCRLSFTWSHTIVLGFMCLFLFPDPCLLHVKMWVDSPDGTRYLFWPCFHLPSYSRCFSENIKTDKKFPESCVILCTQSLWLYIACWLWVFDL